MSLLRYFVVNAFTSLPFTGNPATVVLVPQKFLGDSDSDSWVPYFQKVAGELSSVETAFVLPPDQQKTDYRLRFFTKSKETSFCGHATIAAAHVLSTEFNFPSDHIYFSTKSGVVVVMCSNRKQFELDLHPTLPQPLFAAAAAPPLLTTGKTSGESAQRGSSDSIESIWPRLARVLYPSSPQPSPPAQPAESSGPSAVLPKAPMEVVYHESSQNLILLFDSVHCVTKMSPRPLQLMECITALLPNVQVQKVTVSAIPARGANGGGSSAPSAASVGDEEKRWWKYDFITRLFAPWIGIPEDAVSGATHAILAQYWRTVPSAAALKNKRSLLCFQPSARGGEILLHINGDRVGVAGEAVTICSGSVNKGHM